MARINFLPNSLDNSCALRKRIVGLSGLGLWVLALLLLSSGRDGAEKVSASSAAPDNSVDVRLTEYKIEMPTTLAAGRTTFNITNEGKEKHTFEIKGQGIDKRLGSDLKSGERGTLQADLKPGNYTVNCPVANHDEKGMKMQVTVAP